MKKRAMKKWIPKNTHYCYKINYGKLKQYMIEKRIGIPVIRCKWYEWLPNDNNGCKYVGFKGFDLCLYDQCKICGVSEGI